MSPLSCPDPVVRPVMVQRWTDLVFIHWAYEPTVLQRLLPRGVEVDTFDGRAWVGLIPFTMEGLGLPIRGLAPLPYVGSFPEVNIRTYVRAGDRRGVFFLSLDIDRWLPALVARGVYRIPYCVGNVRHVRVGSSALTRVRRTWPSGLHHATADIAVDIGPSIDQDEPLATFLTARWGLISSRPQGMFGYAPVDHAPWLLKQATLRTLDEQLTVAAGLPAPVGEPHVMFSDGTGVRIGRPRRV